MNIDKNVTKQIDEVKYLATENTYRYRAIIRTMYKSYEKMKYTIYKEEIFESLKIYDDFSSYTIENLKSDLDVLVSWKNLSATADTAKVNTIEEFKNREFRYNLSPGTIEIERMLIKLEHMTIENTSSLESSLVEKFRDLIEKMLFIKDDENKKVYEWFKDLNSSFESLNRNYQDYISKFYSPKNDELMKTTEFLIFKEGFIKYLREFIRTLQNNTNSIQKVFNNINEDTIMQIVHKIYLHEKEIQSIDLITDEKEFKDLNIGRIESMKEWFVSYKGREPLIEQLISNTNEIIRKITRYAANIADKKSNNANRKEEYKKIAKLFSQCSDINECHKISSVVLGSFNIEKIMAEFQRETESTNSSIYDETPSDIIIKPKIRTYREKIIKNPIVNKEERKKEKLMKILEKRKEESKILHKFIHNNEISFDSLPVINTEERVLLLRLLSKGRSRKREWSKNENGMEYKVVLCDGDNIKVACDDGNLSMPPYKIIFKEEL